MSVCLRYAFRVSIDRLTLFPWTPNWWRPKTLYRVRGIKYNSYAVLED